VLEEFPVGEFEDALHPSGEVNGVRDHDDRETVRAIHIEQEISELRCVHPVQCTGGLVGEKKLRLIDQRTRDRSALALAPGELARSMT
jgi:hypothetical protein